MRVLDHAAIGIGAISRMVRADSMPWACAILYQGALGNSIVTRILSAKPLVFIGQISYSLYLWHWPLLSLAKYEASTRSLSGLEVTVVLAAGFLVAAASWRYVERPFRRMRGNSMHLPFSSIRVMSSVFLLAIGLIGVFNREVAWRYPGFVEKRVAGRGMYNSRTCFLEGDQAPDAWRGAECFISSGHDVNVTLWGDSFAAHYAPGIVEEAGAWT